MKLSLKFTTLLAPVFCVNRRIWAFNNNALFNWGRPN